MANLDDIKELIKKKLDESPVNHEPEWINDDRLENAFKEPEYDDKGYCKETLPILWGQYSYGQKDGILYICSRSAMIQSDLYNRYLDEKAIVWDSYQKRLLIFYPDEHSSKIALKGSCWRYAFKLKERESQSLEEVYRELLKRIEEFTN